MRVRTVRASSSSFAEDYVQRIGPDVMTVHLRDAVPVVAACEFRYLVVTEGSCEAELPLIESSTNQHGTHQALLMAMACDYTGGLALGSLIRGLPIRGVHPIRDGASTLLWLVRADIRYAEPSCEDLLLRCEVPEELRAKVQARFWRGATQVIPLDVQLTSRSGRKVATATMTYYLKHSEFLPPQSVGASGGAMYQHQLKASARLIAAVRGAQSLLRGAGFNDPWSTQAAGQHGALIAKRFAARLPELGPLVAARTLHADQTTREAFARGVTQIINVASGLDFRAFRLAPELPGVRWFDLDLPAMIEEREALLQRMTLPKVERFGLAVDLDLQNPLDCLREHPAFDPTQPTHVIFEGGSMYFEPEKITTIVAKLAALVCHPRSTLWIDIVDPAAVDADPAPHGVHEFVEAMAHLGEPFVFGHSDPAALFAPHGLNLHSVTSASERLQNLEPNPVFSLYRFAVLRAGDSNINRHSRDAPVHRFDTAG